MSSVPEEVLRESLRSWAKRLSEVADPPLSDDDANPDIT
jgi:hypothetical protein